MITLCIKLRVWRQLNAVYTAATSNKPFRLAAVVWGCVSHEFNLDLTTVHGNLNRPRHPGNTLATTPVFMDPYRTRAVMESYSEMQSLPFLGRHEAPISNQHSGSTCTSDVLQFKILQNSKQHFTMQYHYIRCLVVK